MALADRVLGYGQVIASSLLGTAKAIMLSVRGVGDTTDADAEAEGSANEPEYGMPGFFFRPLPPDNDGHMEVIFIKFDDAMQPIGYRDLRISRRVNPKEGEIGFAHYDGGFVSMKRNDTGDGTDIVIYAPRINPDGSVVKAHAISMSTKSGEENVTVCHASGAAVVMSKDGELVLRSDTGAARLIMKGGQFTLQGEKIILQGNVCVGGNPATAVPFAGGPSMVPCPSLFLSIV